MSNKKIFSSCISLSLILHMIAIVFLQKYSIWLPSEKKVVAESVHLFEKKQKDEILKTAFDPKSTPTKEEMLVATKESERPCKLEPLAIDAPTNKMSFPPLFDQHGPLLLASHPLLQTYSISPSMFNLIDHLPKDLLISPLNQTLPSSLRPIAIASPKNLSCPLIQEPPEKEVNDPAVVKKEEILATAKEPITLKSLPNLPKLPTLDELNTVSYSDAFEADLVFLPKEDGKGYIFALTLIAQEELELPKIRQHFTFLIDKSNSIQQGRLNSTKNAIHKALEELLPDDTFNIIAFDSKIEKMAPSALPCTGKSLALAEAFLEKVQLGSFFSSSDLYKALFLTVPHHVKDDELYTTILLTDGEVFAKKPVERAILGDWTRYNQGRVALYAIGLNSDPHLASLDVTTAFNRGKLSNAPTNRGLKRKLLKLLKTIQTPVAKNLSCTVVSDTKVHLFSKDQQMPHLYLEQPYVILGEVETLDDFILFVQGRLKDKWINIKKTISFVNAKKGTKALKSEWALQSAYLLYENYLVDHDVNHIVEASRILEPHHHRVAFQ